MRDASYLPPQLLHLLKSVSRSFYLSIRLLQSAVPKAEVLPARPYVAGNSVGLAGTF